MARFIAVLLLLLLAPATMAEPSQHALADPDWIGGLWHRLTAWISGVGAYLIPDGLQADPGGDTAGIGAHLIPSGIQAEPGGGDTAYIGACLIPSGLQADPGGDTACVEVLVGGGHTARIGACIIPDG